MSHGSCIHTIIQRIENYPIEIYIGNQAGKNNTIISSDTPSWPHQLLVLVKGVAFVKPLGILPMLCAKFKNDLATVKWFMGKWGILPEFWVNSFSSTQMLWYIKPILEHPSVFRVGLWCRSYLGITWITGGRHVRLISRDYVSRSRCRDASVALCDTSYTYVSRKVNCSLTPILRQKVPYLIHSLQV